MNCQEVLECSGTALNDNIRNIPQEREREP
jgi:hypothetical protein